MDKPKALRDAIPSYGWTERKDYGKENRAAIRDKINSIFMKEEQEFLQQANKLVARWPPIMKEALGQEIYDQILQKTKAALIKIKKSTDPTYIHVALHATDLINTSESDITLDELDARTFSSALSYIAAWELDNKNHD